MRNPSLLKLKASRTLSCCCSLLMFGPISSPHSLLQLAPHTCRLTAATSLSTLQHGLPKDHDLVVASVSIMQQLMAAQICKCHMHANICSKECCCRRPNAGTSRELRRMRVFTSSSRDPAGTSVVRQLYLSWVQGRAQHLGRWAERWPGPYCPPQALRGSA